MKQGCAGPVGAWPSLGPGVHCAQPLWELGGLGLSLLCPLCCACLQKMDRNKDGVVTIEEFLESCQKVKSPAALLCARSPPSSLGTFVPPASLFQRGGEARAPRGKAGALLWELYPCQHPRTDEESHGSL